MRDERRQNAVFFHPSSLIPHPFFFLSFFPTSESHCLGGSPYGRNFSGWLVSSVPYRPRLRPSLAAAGESMRALESFTPIWNRTRKPISRSPDRSTTRPRLVGV